MTPGDRESIAPPRVSVVLPLFNGEAHVAGAVRSILNQTMQDFELIVVDDGSSDHGAEVVEQIGDRRLRLLRLPKNSGIANALNIGVREATCELIARMDADDISSPDRLRCQLDFLESHPDVGAVGAIPLLTADDGAPPRPYPVLTRDADLRRLLVLQGPFCHGSVVFRTSAFDAAGGYRTEDEPAEDYALWLRMAAHAALANVPVSLYTLRLRSDSVSSVQRVKQLERRDAIRLAARAQLGPPRLRLAPLREGLAFYRRQERAHAAGMASTFQALHQELAAVDLAARGPFAVRNILVASLLGPMSPRTAIRMYRHYRSACE